MSEMRATSCDGCNEIAPADYLGILPCGGWIHVDASGEDLDACSWPCLATIVAAHITEGVDA